MLKVYILLSFMNLELQKCLALKRIPQRTLEEFFLRAFPIKINTAAGESPTAPSNRNFPPETTQTSPNNRRTFRPQSPALNRDHSFRSLRPVMQRTNSAPSSIGSSAAESNNLRIDKFFIKNELGNICASSRFVAFYANKVSNIFRDKSERVGRSGQLELKDSSNSEFIYTFEDGLKLNGVFLPEARTFFSGTFPGCREVRLSYKQLSPQYDVDVLQQVIVMKDPYLAQNIISRPDTQKRYIVFVPIRKGGEDFTYMLFNYHRTQLGGINYAEATFAGCIEKGQSWEVFGMDLPRRGPDSHYLNLKTEALPDKTTLRSFSDVLNKVRQIKEEIANRRTNRR